MDKTQTIIKHGWYERFKCIGGPCSYNCCRPQGWKIEITDEEIERYKQMDHPFREEILRAIDLEKKVFLSKKQLYGDDTENGEQCALQTDDGWCKIVLNCGEEYLTDVCDHYPKSTFSVNNTSLYAVDVTCPVVAEYLFDNTTIVNTVTNALYVAETEQMDEIAFSFLSQMCSFLSDLFLNVDEFEAGKCYILFSVVNLLQTVLSQEVIKDIELQNILNKYTNEDTIISVLTECETINENREQKAVMANIAIKLFYEILIQIAKIDKELFSDIERHISEWKDNKYLKDDLDGFYRYRDENFPKFVDNFLAYRVFLSSRTNDLSTIEKDIKVGYVTIFLEELAAMSVWKSKGGILSKGDYSCIISKIERRIEHSQIHKNIIMAGIKQIETELDFSMFLLPVY